MKTRSKMGKIKDINDDNYESLMPWREFIIYYFREAIKY
jgi:hypothetical protein